jgi:hypothetical protein
MIHGVLTIETSTPNRSDVEHPWPAPISYFLPARLSAQYFLIRRLTALRAAADIRRRFRRGRSIVAARSEDVSICGRLGRDPTPSSEKLLSQRGDLGPQLPIAVFSALSGQLEDV